MCKCNPMIRTPWCGKPGCEQPEQFHQKNEEETFNQKCIRLGLMESTVTNMVDEIDSLRKQVATQTTEAFTTNPEQERTCDDCKWNDKGVRYCLNCSKDDKSNFQPKQEIK